MRLTHGHQTAIDIQIVLRHALHGEAFLKATSDFLTGQCPSRSTAPMAPSLQQGFATGEMGFRGHFARQQSRAVANVLECGIPRLFRWIFCQPPAERGGLWSSRAMTASAARSPFCHAPPTVPHKVWWTASPANQTTSFKGSDKALRASCAPGGTEENAPRVQGSLVQDVACTRKTAVFAREPKTPEIQSSAKSVIAFSPLSASSTPLRPAKVRRDRRVPCTLAKSAAVLVV